MSNKYATRWKDGIHLPSGFIPKVRGYVRSGLISLISTINNKNQDVFLRCLYCHNVFDDQKNDFDNLISKLKKMGNFIDTDKCIEMIKGVKPIDGKYYHLSFDDGFRNNYINAVPILKKHSIPAIFFVPSSLIGADWDTANKYSIGVTQNKSTIELLRLSDLKNMLGNGFEIGSHTRSHANFAAISNDNTLLGSEILGSKIDLERLLGIECKYIAWPYGKLVDSDEKSLKMVKDAGYLACFGAYRGAISPNKTDLFSIPRHHFEIYWPITEVEFFAMGKWE